MPINNLEPVKDDILNLLAIEPLTVVDLANQLKRSYTTVQQAHKNLKDEGRIIRYDNRQRGAKWVVAPSYEVGNKTIPYVRFMGENHPMTNFQGYENLTNIANEAVHTIIKSWVSIATASLRLNRGIADDSITKRLRPVKADLIKARATLQDFVFLTQQMIDNDKLWSTESITSFVEDDKWNDHFLEKLDELYTYYFKGPHDD